MRIQVKDLRHFMGKIAHKTGLEIHENVKQHIYKIANSILVNNR